MNTPSTAEALTPDSGENLAPVILFDAASQEARAEEGAVLSESAEQAPAGPVQQLVNVISKLKEEVSYEEYKAALTKTFGLMDQFVKDGLLNKVKNDKGKEIYDPIPGNDESGTIFATFKVVIEEVKKRKPLKTESDKGRTPKPEKSAQPAKPEKKAETGEKTKQTAKSETKSKPDVRPVSKPVNPLAVEMDGKTFNTPQEALEYSNRLKSEAEAFRQRYFGLLKGKTEKIDEEIKTALAQIEKTERIASKGDNIGIIDIMRPFVDNGVVAYRRPLYYPNPTIERANVLAEAANRKEREINEKIEKDKKAYEERQARREAAYNEVLQSGNGFERTIADDKGKEVTRFAYQIEVSKIPGTTIQQITVKKVVPKFGYVKLQEGSVYVLGDKNTPPFLNKAANLVIAERRKKAQGGAKLADVMPADIGGKGKESK